jgi:hypothetical protein
MPRGVHFAISAAQAKRLLRADDDDELAEMVDEIEEEWKQAFETDKGWDALHRCFSNGSLELGEGASPLRLAIFGGNVLNEQADYFVVLLTPIQVSKVAKELGRVTESWLRGRYFDQEFPDYEGEKSDEDFAYTWSCFKGMPEFFASAAKAKKHVIFTVAE